MVDNRSNNFSTIFFIEINDLSMSPDFQIGDKIILDPTLQAEAGDFVLATSNGQDIFFQKVPCAWHR